MTTSEIGLALEKRLLDAIVERNISELGELLHDDLLFMLPDGQIITKEIDLESHRNGSMVVERIALEVENINAIGDTIIVSVVYDTKGNMLGTPIVGRFRYIRVWKNCGNWKVIGGSCVQLADQ